MHMRGYGGISACMHAIDHVGACGSPFEAQAHAIAHQEVTWGAPSGSNPKRPDTLRAAETELPFPPAASMFGQACTMNA